MQPPAVDFLYVNIGRGHPFYLDGIHACLPEAAVGNVRDVLDLCRGPAGGFWRLARWLYTRGSSRGGSRPLYSRLRRCLPFDRPSPLLRWLGAPLARARPAAPRSLLVSHPLVVAMLPPDARIYYQHGELAVPREALLQGPHHVLVPDQNAASVFLKAGFAPEKVLVTGLCIEPPLVAQASTAYPARKQRLASDIPLTGAFLSSGAEPRLHVHALVEAAVSAVSSGGGVMLIARLDGEFHAHAVTTFAARGLPLVLADAEAAAAPKSTERATLYVYRTRRALQHITAQRFPLWDYFCAPPHERSHWALGLGLPMFIVDPPIGTFAPLNRERLLAEGVAEALSPDAGSSFAARLNAMRADGTLIGMAEAGWGRYNINGFARAAEMMLAAQQNAGLDSEIRQCRAD